MTEALKSMAKRKSAILLVCIVALLILLAFVLPQWQLSLLNYLVICIILTLGLNLCLGFCGLPHFGVAAFFGIGAYSFAITMHAHLGLALSIVISLVIICVLTLLLGFILLRLRGLTFALGTLSLSIGLYYLVGGTWRDVFGGTDGLYVGVLMPAKYVYLLVLAVGFAVAVFCDRMGKGKIGLVWRGIMEDESILLASGINTMHYRRLAFAFTGVICGLAGILYMFTIGSIAPDGIGIHLNILILVANIVGGTGTIFGPILGGFIVPLLPYALGPLEEFSTVIYGSLLLLILIISPRGLWHPLAEFFSKKVWVRIIARLENDRHR